MELRCLVVLYASALRPERNLGRELGRKRILYSETTRKSNERPPTRGLCFHMEV